MTSEVKLGRRRREVLGDWEVRHGVEIELEEPAEGTESGLAVAQLALTRRVAGQQSKVIPLAAMNETFHTNPMRKRGRALSSSLALRVGIGSTGSGLE